MTVVIPIDRGSDTSTGHESGSVWRLCGSKYPRAQLQYFSQILLIYVVVAVSLVNLSTGSYKENEKLWIVLLSSSIGYLLPNPSLKLPNKWGTISST